MTDSRPNPIALAETLRGLGSLHEALAPYATTKPRGGASERVASSDGTEHAAPGHWTAIAVRADIHNFAHAHAKMLAEDRGVRPQANSTTALLEFAATYPGYFTGHTDPQIAYSIVDEAETLEARANSVLTPNTESHRTPIGPCAESGCDGSYRIHWREGGGTDEARAWKIRESRPIAKCSKNPEHRVDAMLYASGPHA